jgi:hypothetical protein
METPKQTSLTSQENLPTNYGAQSMRQALAERLMPSEGMDAVQRLLSCYPHSVRSEATGGYLGALAAVLCDYPKSIALNCCDPRKGVARETKFLPTVNDIVVFCEREIKSMRNIVDRDDREKSILAGMQARREAFESGEPAEERKAFIAKRREELGANWGINTGKPRPPTREEAREVLIAQIGQEAFDALPDTGIRTDDWQKLRAPPLDAPQ